MTETIGSKALIPNPKLKVFEALIGVWNTTGTHPYMSDTVLHGRISFDWFENGSFMIARSEIDDPNFPDSVQIFGSDDAADAFYLLHFDERGVSRKYDVTMIGNQLTWSRDDPHFSQRFTMTIEGDGNKMTSKGEMSREGGEWEADLSLTCERSQKV